MTKFIKNAKVTIQTDEGTYTFTPDEIHLWSTDGGKTHCVNAFECRNLILEATDPTSSGEPPQDAAPSPSKLTAQQECSLNGIVEAARAAERAKYNSARAIQRSQDPAVSDGLVRRHDLVMAALKAAHTGLNYDQITEHLHSLGLKGFEDTVNAALEGDIELRYPELEA